MPLTCPRWLPPPLPQGLTSTIMDRLRQALKAHLTGTVVPPVLPVVVAGEIGGGGGQRYTTEQLFYTNGIILISLRGEGFLWVVPVFPFPLPQASWSSCPERWALP